METLTCLSTSHWTAIAIAQVSVPRVGGTGLAQVFKADVEKKEDDGGLEKAAETHASTIMTLQNKG